MIDMSKMKGLDKVNGINNRIAEKLGFVKKNGFYDEACISPKDYWITPLGRITSYLPDWASDITATMYLVNDIIESGCWASIDTPFQENGKYSCSIADKGKITGLSVEAETMEMAICKAWLQWKDI